MRLTRHLISSAGGGGGITLGMLRYVGLKAGKRGGEVKL